MKNKALVIGFCLFVWALFIWTMLTVGGVAP